MALIIVIFRGVGIAAAAADAIIVIVFIVDVIVIAAVVNRAVSIQISTCSQRTWTRRRFGIVYIIISSVSVDNRRKIINLSIRNASTDTQTFLDSHDSHPKQP